MLIKHVWFGAFDRRSSNQLQVWITCLDLLVVLRIASIVRSRAVKPIFIANFHVMQGKGCGVSVFCALGTPLGTRVAAYILDLIQCVLYVRFECRAWIDMLLCHRIAGIHC